MPILLRRFPWSELPKNFFGFDSESTKTIAAKALHSVLLGALPFGVLYLGLVIPLFVARKAAASAMWAAIILITLACIFLLRRGYVALSSWIFLSTSWLILATFVTLSGGIASPALLSHIAVVVVAAWLVGRRAAIWIAILSLSFGLTIAIMESIGVHLPRYFPVPPMVAWVIVAALVSLAILPQASVNQALVDSAKKAQLELEARLHQEQARAESDERFRATFLQAAVGIAHVGLDGKWFLLNDRFGQMLGYTEAELREKTFQDITHPDDMEESLNGRHKLLAGEISSHTMEKRYIRKDGTIFWGRLYRSLARDRDNVPRYFIAVVEDISEKIQADRALRDSEQRLTLAQDAAYLGVWDRDLRTDVITIWGKYPQLHGLPPERTSLTVDEWASLIHPDDRERVLELRREAREGTHTFAGEFRVIWPEGGVHWLRARGTVFADDSGRPIRTMGVIGDITERKQAEAALLESEKRLKNAERLAHLGHWQWDLKSKQLIWSEECFRIFGRPPNYTPSLESVLQALIPEDRERVERETGYRLAEKKGGAIEFRMVRPDGDLRTIRSVSEMVLDEEGQPASFFGACQDITEERRAQEESFARQKLESVGTLASGIAHDFNNLLGGVLAQAELGLGELAAGSNPEAELKAVRDVALRGSEIVRELMIYAGKESAVVRLVDVSQIVQEMLELLKVSVSKHAKLEGNLGKDLPPVRANAAQISQLVMNLVTNASEAIGDRDGVIGLTTKCMKIGRDSGAISDRLAEGDYVQLEVSDTGHGMLPEAQAKVFDPFFTTKSAGHGLGLAIVQGIVRAVGGSIHLRSEPDKGTTFQILLPCAETQSEASSDAVSDIKQSARPSPDATVLVVEDEDTLRQAVAKMLRHRGFKVFEAGDGFSASRLLRAKLSRIDLILLDLTIPGASSREVVAEAAQVWPDIKVILTSAYGEEMITNAVSAPQIRGFIRKPFQMDDLVKKLRNTLSMG